MLRRVLGIVLVLACVLTACSSDDESVSPTTTPADIPETTVPTTATSETTMTTPSTIPEIPTGDGALTELAYVWGYPLVVTQRTMQTLGALLGVNELFWQTSLSGPASRLIVAPNRDTLYSVAILELRR